MTSQRGKLPVVSSRTDHTQLSTSPSEKPSGNSVSRSKSHSPSHNLALSSPGSSPSSPPSAPGGTAIHLIQLPKLELCEHQPQQQHHRSLSTSLTENPNPLVKDSSKVFHLQPLLHQTSNIQQQYDHAHSFSTIPINPSSTVKLEPLFIHSPIATNEKVIDPPPQEEMIREQGEDSLSQNGEVVILYEMYQEKFPIVSGTISSDTINELYGLTEIMPNCTLLLSQYSPSEVREMIISSSSTLSTLPLGSLGYPDWYLPYEPDTKIHRGLADNQKYYCYVREKREEGEGNKQGEREEQEARDRKHKREEEAQEIQRADDGRGFDSCTCIYGAPCQVLPLAPRLLIV
jgi:hypothetical protein